MSDPAATHASEDEFAVVYTWLHIFIVCISQAMIVPEGMHYPPDHAAASSDTFIVCWVEAMKGRAEACTRSVPGVGV